MVRAGVTQFVGDGAAGEFGPVAVAAEVDEEDVTAPLAGDLVHRGGGSVVAEVAVPAEDALFGGPRAGGIVLEKFDVVIRFEDQGVDVADTFENEVRGVAEVGQNANAMAGGALVNAEADGISGVVGDGKVFDFQVADGEGATGGEESPRGACAVFPFGVFGERFGGEAVGVDG